MRVSVMALLATIAPSVCLAQSENIITVKNNEVFKITLPSNPTTGSGWMVKTLPENVVLTGMEYSQSSDCKGAMGCGGNESIYFKAIRQGSGKVVLKYGRSFEDLPKDSTVKTIIVK